MIAKKCMKYVIIASFVNIVQTLFYNFFPLSMFDFFQFRISREKKSWIDLERKKRGDAVSTENKQVIFTFWSYEASRRTGDKKDVIRKRSGKKPHIEHAKHTLERMETEVFLDFTAQHPEIKIKHRKFESLKIIFVQSVREKDRRSCLCRKQVQTQMVFKDCMKFRKAFLRRTGSNPMLPQTLTEAVNLTLYAMTEGCSHHKLKCLNRECNK